MMCLLLYRFHTTVQSNLIDWQNKDEKYQANVHGYIEQQQFVFSRILLTVLHGDFLGNLLWSFNNINWTLIKSGLKENERSL